MKLLFVNEIIIILLSFRVTLRGGLQKLLEKWNQKLFVLVPEYFWEHAFAVNFMCILHVTGLTWMKSKVKIPKLLILLLFFSFHQWFCLRWLGGGGSWTSLIIHSSSFHPAHCQKHKGIYSHFLHRMWMAFQPAISWKFWLKKVVQLFRKLLLNSFSANLNMTVSKSRC